MSLREIQRIAQVAAETGQLEIVPRALVPTLDTESLEWLERYYEMQSALYEARGWRAHYVTTERRLREVRAVLKRLFRLTLTINYVVHHKYYSIRLQRWDRSKSRLESLESRLREKIVRRLEDHLGFDRYEWWFPDEPAVELEEVPYDKKLVGKEELEFETLS